MFLEEITLKNFMIHRNFKVSFEKITAIMGNSGEGKTTILRALDLVINNKPRKAKKLVSHGQDDFLIKVKTKDYIILRTLKKYILIDKKTKERSVFKAFGSNVPVPISNIFNINEINWQRQHDPHFLVFQSGGYVAKFLDKSFGNTESKELIETSKKIISDLKTDYKVNMNKKKENEEIIKNLNNISLLDPLVKKINSLKLQKEEISKNLEKLLYYTGTLKSLKFYDAKKILDLKEGIEDAKRSIEISNKLEEQIGEIENLVKKLKSIKIIEEKSISKISKNFARANSVFESKNILETEISKLSGYINTLRSIKDYSEEVDEIHKMLDFEMKNIGYCPLCERSYE